MKVTVHCVQVRTEDDTFLREFHVFKGKARQAAQAVATTGKRAALLEVTVESEPRDIVVAALEGHLEELATFVAVEEYVPTHEMKLAPGSWGWERVAYDE